MLTILAQEFRAWKERRLASLAILFGVPVVYTLLFGLVYGANVIKDIPLVVYDQDQTVVSRSLVQAFADSERYEIVGHVDSQEELAEYLRDNRAMAALAIPPRFSRDIKHSRAATIALELNASNLMFANNVLSTYPEITQSFAAAAGQKLVEGLNQPPSQALAMAAPVRLSVRIVDNPTVSYSSFVLPGLTVNGLLIAIYLVSCTLLTAEYAALARGKQSVWAIIAGKLLPCWLLSVVAFVVSIGLLVAWFPVPLRGSLLQLLAIGGAFAYAVAAFGLLVSSLTPNVIVAMQYSAVYVMSSFLCSGYSWPLFAMNDLMRAYAAIQPITYAAVTVRDILLVAVAPDLPKNILVLIFFGSVCYTAAVAILTLRRRKMRAAPGEDTP
jgi:ABC-2 type transport system permease protein